MDIILGLVIFFGTLFLSYLLFQCCKTNLTHTRQMLLVSLTIVGVCVSISYIFGNTVVHYLVNGLAVGFGIGLQPLFKNIINGFVFDGTQINGVIECNGVKGEIKRVGLLHTWVLDDNGKLVMMNNNLLAEKPVKLHSCKF